MLLFIWIYCIKYKYAKNYDSNYENENLFSLDFYMQENMGFGNKLVFFKIYFSKILLETIITKVTDQKKRK